MLTFYIASKPGGIENASIFSLATAHFCMHVYIEPQSGKIQLQIISVVVVQHIRAVGRAESRQHMVVVVGREGGGAPTASMADTTTTLFLVMELSL